MLSGLLFLTCLPLQPAASAGLNKKFLLFGNLPFASAEIALNVLLRGYAASSPKVLIPKISVFFLF